MYYKGYMINRYKKLKKRNLKTAKKRLKINNNNKDNIMNSPVKIKKNNNPAKRRDVK